MPKKAKRSSEVPKAEVKQFVLSNGADRVGVASVEELLEAALPEGRRPGDILPHYLRCGVCMNVCPAREPAGRK